jgi:cell division protein FtsA
MAKQKNSVVGILDIGSSKIVCFIARIISGTKIEIIGIGHNISHGIKAGRITDIKLAETSIIQAVEAAEKMADHRIKKVYVSLSSNNLISQRLSSDLMVTGHEINDKDINRLLFQVLDRYNEQELEVIHTFAYDYMLDGNRGIDNPHGMYGNKLTGDFHVVSTPATNLLNLSNCYHAAN